MGARHAAWCVGCCWALMAALFALGVMSLAWTALVAALIALEKTLPYRRAGTWGTAAVLVVLAVALVAAPHAVPGFVVPGLARRDARDERDALAGASGRNCDLRLARAHRPSPTGLGHPCGVLGSKASYDAI